MSQRRKEALWNKIRLIVGLINGIISNVQRSSLFLLPKLHKAADGRRVTCSGTRWDEREGNVIELLRQKSLGYIRIAKRDEWY